MPDFEPRDLLLIGGLAVGLAFGLLAQRSRFCFRAALVEASEGRAPLQLRGWLLAVAVALLGTQVLRATTEIDWSGVASLAPTLGIGSLVLGGLLFGLGMVLSGGCGARHLVLAATGNLRSWIVLLVFAVTAYATMNGLLALPRLALQDATAIAVESQHLPGLLTAATGLSESVAGWLLAAGLALPLAVLALRRGGTGAGRRVLACGAAIGLLVPAAWYITGVLAYDEFDPAAAEALRFTGPVARGLQYLMTYTGAQADFGIVVIGGTLLGAALGGLFGRELRLVGFAAPEQLLRYAAGGALMGVGGVLAVGCTIGQGLTGLSTLSLGSLLAIAAIALGGRLALAWRARGGAPALALSPGE